MQRHPVKASLVVMAIKSTWRHLVRRTFNHHLSVAQVCEADPVQGKPAAFGAVPAVARSASRPKKSMDDKARNGTQTTGGAAATSSPSTQETTKDKTTSRSQSRKRGSLFGTLLGKKEEHDEKKEVSKEDKVTGKEIQQEEKEEKKEEKAEKQELKKEGKLEKKAEKQELKKEEKLEKKAEKEHKNDGEAHPAPLNAAAIGKCSLTWVSPYSAEHSQHLVS